MLKDKGDGIIGALSQ